MEAAELEEGAAALLREGLLCFAILILFVSSCCAVNKVTSITTTLTLISLPSQSAHQPSSGYPQIAFSMSGDSSRMVSILLEMGADIHRADNNGVMPRLAAENPEIIEMLDVAAQTQHAQ